MARTTCLVCLVSTVSGMAVAKTHSEKQALVAGTKQSKKAERAHSGQFFVIW